MATEASDGDPTRWLARLAAKPSDRVALNWLASHNVRLPDPERFLPMVRAAVRDMTIDATMEYVITQLARAHPNLYEALVYRACIAGRQKMANDYLTRANAARRETDDPDLYHLAAARVALRSMEQATIHMVATHLNAVSMAGRRRIDYGYLRIQYLVIRLRAMRSTPGGGDRRKIVTTQGHLLTLIEDVLPQTIDNDRLWPELMFRRATVLKDLGRHEEAIAVYKAIFERSGEETHLIRATRELTTLLPLDNVGSVYATAIERARQPITKARLWLHWIDYYQQHKCWGRVCATALALRRALRDTLARVTDVDGRDPLREANARIEATLQTWKNLWRAGLRGEGRVLEIIAWMAFEVTELHPDERQLLRQAIAAYLTNHRAKLSTLGIAKIENFLARLGPEGDETPPTSPTPVGGDPVVGTDAGGASTSVMAQKGLVRRHLRVIGGERTWHKVPGTFHGPNDADQKVPGTWRWPGPWDPTAVPRGRLATEGVSKDFTAAINAAVADKNVLALFRAFAGHLQFAQPSHPVRALEIGFGSEFALIDAACVAGMDVTASEELQVYRHALSLARATEVATGRLQIASADQIEGEYDLVVVNMPPPYHFGATYFTRPVKPGGYIMIQSDNPDHINRFVQDAERWEAVINIPTTEQIFPTGYGPRLRHFAIFRRK